MIFQHVENDDAWGRPLVGDMFPQAFATWRITCKCIWPAGKNVLDYDSIMQMFMSRVPANRTVIRITEWDGPRTTTTASSYFVTMGTLRPMLASMVVLPDRDIGVVVLGDGYDSVAGNSLFFNLANGVLDVAMGNNAVDLDETEYDEEHAEANAEWVHFWFDLRDLPLLFVLGMVLCCAIACAKDRKDSRACCGNRRYCLVCLRVRLGYRFSSKHGNAVA